MTKDKDKIPTNSDIFNLICENLPKESKSKDVHLSAFESNKTKVKLKNNTKQEGKVVEIKADNTLLVKWETPAKLKGVETTEKGENLIIC